ncbi:hypothetical protein [Deinococcus sp.]|uniref:hypothetical protein n=1 Tax=Deinococcus sp. TaxID=47478 RepID=UPI003B5AF17A
MKRLFFAALTLVLAACAPRLDSGPPTLNCDGERFGRLSRVPFTLSANITPQTNEVAGVLTEGGEKSFWVYGRRIADGPNFNLILSITDQTESYIDLDLILKKARLGYFSSSKSTLTGVLSGADFEGRQKAGVNNYVVTMACQSG